MAGPEELEECRNEAYMEGHGMIEFLKAEVSTYKTKVATLKYVPVWQLKLIDNCCSEVLQTTIALKVAEPRTTEHQGNIEATSATLPPLGKGLEALSRGQYPSVKYWTRSAYNRARRKDKGNTNALAIACPKRGRPCRAAEDDSDEEADNADTSWDCLDPNKMPKHPYIETEDGRPASREILCAIGIKARRIWQTLAGKGLAPTKWSLVTDAVHEYFTQEMLSSFMELRLCENNWKLQLWITRSYSSWYQNYSKLKAKKKTSSSDLTTIASTVSGSSASTTDNSTAANASSAGSASTTSNSTAADTGSARSALTTGNSAAADTGSTGPALTTGNSTAAGTSNAGTSASATNSGNPMVAGTSDASSNSGENNSADTSNSVGNPATGAAPRSLRNPR